MIEVKNLNYAYNNGPPVFQNFNWTVAQGETWAVLGPSGCGKSTLLYLLAGLLFPGRGEVRIHGQILARPRPRTGLILQEYGLLPWGTVRQNIELGLRIRNFYGPDGKHAPLAHQQQDQPTPADVDDWLARLGLAKLADKYPDQLSGGQRQRTAIARTLVLRPDLLLMDEPFSSLDAPTRESLQNLTLELCQEQRLTLVIVTHAIEEAACLGRKILLLSQPPNTTPPATTLDNPNAGQLGYRQTTEYFELCRSLRSQMEPP